MKEIVSQWVCKEHPALRFFGVFIAGALSSLIFPPFKNNVCGYVALILFLTYLFYEKRTKKTLFWLAYLFGFSFYLVGFSWINNALLVDEARLSNYIPLSMFAIGCFFALFWSVPAVFIFWGKDVYRRMLLFCAAYVTMEWVRSFIFTGFPWNLLGTALAFDPRWIQGAAYIGTYGLSLAVLLFCCGVGLLLQSFLQKRFYKGSLFFIFIPLLFVGICSLRYHSIQELDGLKVRLVQPNIAQTLKWQPERIYQNFRRYIEMSKAQALDDVDLVVWGETATPYALDRDMTHLAELTEAVPVHGFLITGLIRIGMDSGKQILYNSLFVINSQGEIKDYYDKSHLVPFGEFLPFRDYLPEFMKPVANIVGDLGRGEKYKNINVEGLPLMGGAICYESIFPKEVINPKQKPHILLVLANDGWYGISAGPYQHLTASQMRAVEEGVTVVRSANTGISAVIGDNGEIIGRIDLDEAGVLDVRLPALLAHSTIYGTYGNWVLLLLIGVVLLICFVKRR